MTIPTLYYTLIRRDPNIVVYYRFNEKTGLKAYDWANKYNLNGRYIMTPSFNIPVIYGDASAGSTFFGLESGNINLVEVADASPLHIIGDITLEGWIISKERKQGYIISKVEEEIHGNAAPYTLKLTSAGKFQFALGNGTNETIVESSSVVALGVPVHFVATSFRKKMKIYVNGQEKGSGTLLVEVADKGKSLFIGAREGFSFQLEGRLGEVAIYNAGFSAKKALEHYNLGRRILENQPYITTYDPPSYS